MSQSAIIGRLVDMFIPELIDRIEGRMIDPDNVFDLTLPLEQVPERYHAMDDRWMIKVLLRR